MSDPRYTKAPTHDRRNQGLRARQRIFQITKQGLSGEMVFPPIRTLVPKGPTVELGSMDTGSAEKLPVVQVLSGRARSRKSASRSPRFAAVAWPNQTKPSYNDWRKTISALLSIALGSLIHFPRLGLQHLELVQLGSHLHLQGRQLGADPALQRGSTTLRV